MLPDLENLNKRGKKRQQQKKNGKTNTIKKYVKGRKCEQN